MPKPNYNGGFSASITATKVFREYVTHNPCGYIGSSQRNNTRDRIVEQFLRSAGLGCEGIAFWLTSTSARHMMDNVERRMNTAAFGRQIKPYTETAFREVTIWSHPDHTGSLLSSRDLGKKIFGEAH